MHLKKASQPEFHSKYFLFGCKNLKTKFFKSHNSNIFCKVSSFAIEGLMSFNRSSLFEIA